MNEPERKRRGPITLFCESRRFRWSIIALAALFLPIVYVTSFGPACWINLRTGRGGLAIGAFYRPLGWVYRQSEVTQAVIDPWVNLGRTDDRRFCGLADGGPIWVSIFDLRSDFLLIPIIDEPDKLDGFGDDRG